MWFRKKTKPKAAPRAVGMDTVQGLTQSIGPAAYSSLITSSGLLTSTWITTGSYYRSWVEQPLAPATLTPAPPPAVDPTTEPVTLPAPLLRRQRWIDPGHVEPSTVDMPDGSPPP